MSYFQDIFAKYKDIKHVCCQEQMEMWVNDRIGESVIKWFCLSCDNEINCEVIS